MKFYFPQHKFQPIFNVDFISSPISADYAKKQYEAIEKLYNFVIDFKK